MKEKMQALRVRDSLHRKVKSKCVDNGVNITAITEALLEAWIDGRVQIAFQKPVVKQKTEIGIESKPKHSGSEDQVRETDKEIANDVQRSWVAEDKVERELELERKREEGYEVKVSGETAETLNEFNKLL